MDPLFIPEPPPPGTDDIEWFLAWALQDGPKFAESVRRYAEKLQRVFHPPAPPRAIVPASEVNDQRLAKYSAGALEDEMRQVWNATEGSRNETVFLAAANLRRFIRAGALRESDVTERLVWAGTHTGLTERECLQAIHAGYRKDDASGTLVVLPESDGDYGDVYQLDGEQS